MRPCRTARWCMLVNREYLLPRAAIWAWGASSGPGQPLLLLLLLLPAMRVQVLSDDRLWSR